MKVWFGVNAVKATNYVKIGLTVQAVKAGLSVNAVKAGLCVNAVKAGLGVNAVKAGLDVNSEISSRCECGQSRAWCEAVKARQFSAVGENLHGPLAFRKADL